MAVRIRYQSMTAFSAVGTYAEALRRHATKVVLPETEVVFQGVDPHLYGDLVPGDVFPYPYMKHVIQCEALEACYQAEKLGDDAFVVGSFSEPFLRQSRSAVDIPVLSLAESAFLNGCALAEKFALITLSPQYARRVSEVVERHHMTDRVSGIFDLGRLTEREANAGLTDPAALLAAFHVAADHAIASGADLLLPAEGILNEVLYVNGINRIRGAAVMDCVGVVLMHAEMLIRMKRQLGLGVGREWSYPMAPREMTVQLRRNAGLPD